MNTPPRKIPEAGLYKPVWREFNRLIDYVREISPMGGRNIQQRRTMNGTLTVATPAQASEPGDPGTVKRYIVRSVQNDHLVCDELTISGGLDSRNVKIAKPFNLRYSGWNGVTVSYTPEPYPGAPSSLNILYTFVTSVYRLASVITGGGSTVEHQIIIPRYVPNLSVVYAIESENGNGVTVTEGDPPMSVSVDLVDINADGRAWAAAI